MDLPTARFNPEIKLQGITRCIRATSTPCQGEHCLDHLRFFCLSPLVNVQLNACERDNLDAKQRRRCSIVTIADDHDTICRSRYQTESHKNTSGTNATILNDKKRISMVSLPIQNLGAINLIIDPFKTCSVAFSPQHVHCHYHEAPE